MNNGKDITVGIKKINKLDNLGIYRDFSWPNGLEELKRFNVFYGWNGAGKTTLSRLFQIVDSGSHSDFPNVEYEIEYGSEEKYSDKHSGGFDYPIRVFNTDFIENNIDFKKSESAKFNIILGQKNKEIEKQINNAQANLSEVNEEIKKAAESLDYAQKEKEKEFTNVARSIALLCYSQNNRYVAPNAKKDFQDFKGEGIFTGSITISDEEFEKYKNFVGSESREKISEALPSKLDCSALILRIENICKKTVDNTIIEELESNPAIKNWVERGFELHKQQKWDECAFCTNNISSDRIRKLSNYFNIKYKELIAEIDKELDDIGKVIEWLNQIYLPDKARFFKDDTDKYETEKEKFKEECTKLISQLRELQMLVNEKKSYMDEPRQLSSDLINSLVNCVIDYNFSLQQLYDIINSHNNKVKNYEFNRDKARAEIKKYYLLKVYNKLYMERDGDLSLEDTIFYQQKN